MADQRPHYRDMRRARGRYFKAGQQYEQFPVICAADIIDQPVTMRSRVEHVATLDKRAVRCTDCRKRLGIG